HGLWGKHNCSYKDVLNVPFIAHVPGDNWPSVFSGKVSLIDLLPTFTQVAGIEHRLVDGVPLSQRIQDGGSEYVVAEGEGFVTISDGQYKFTRVRQQKAEYAELVDLTADPYEYRNCIDDPAYQ